MIIQLDKKLTQKEIDLANYLAQQEIQDCYEYFEIMEQQFSLSVLFKNCSIADVRDSVMRKIYNEYFDKHTKTLKLDKAKEILDIYSKRMDLDELNSEEYED